MPSEARGKHFSAGTKMLMEKSVSVDDVGLFADDDLRWMI